MLKLADARAAAPKLAHADLPRPPFVGRRLIEDVPLAELVPLIDWTFFFHAWEMKGLFPQLLDDPNSGPAARDLFAAAKKLLDEIVAGKLLQARAAYGFWPAQAEGDDIALFADEARTQSAERLPMLRQQEAADGKPRLSLADFVAPAPGRDHLGAFAITAGLGADVLVARYERALDDYHAIMVKALADRLAEAGAE